jgi:hypothetical protein
MNKTASLAMCRYVTVGTIYCDVNLDDIAIYTKALSTTEVALLYENGVVSGDVKGGNPKWISDLRYLCLFNKVTSFPTIPDDSGNGYDGTATNMESGDITGF